MSALTTEKMAVLAPMERASVRMTVAVKPGLRASWRRAWRRLRVDELMRRPPWILQGESRDFGQFLCQTATVVKSWICWTSPVETLDAGFQDCPRADTGVRRWTRRVWVYYERRRAMVRLFLNAVGIRIQD